LFFQIEAYGSRKSRSYIDDEAFDQVVCLHLQVIYHINVSHNYEAAYTTHTQIMQTFNKEVLQKKKEVNWFIPIFHQLCRDLLNIAKMKSRSIYNKEDSYSQYDQSIVSYLFQVDLLQINKLNLLKTFDSCD
ncbi:hypothetical protein COOONC_14269, partial [Cooperia oncophora]